MPFAGSPERQRRAGLSACLPATLSDEPSAYKPAPRRHEAGPEEEDGRQWETREERVGVA